jgi:hypothetical protein
MIAYCHAGHRLGLFFMASVCPVSVRGCELKLLSKPAAPRGYQRTYRANRQRQEPSGPRRCRQGRLVVGEQYQHEHDDDHGKHQADDDDTAAQQAGQVQPRRTRLAPGLSAR